MWLGIGFDGWIGRSSGRNFFRVGNRKSLQGKIQQARQCHQQSYVLLKSHGLEKEMGVSQMLAMFLIGQAI